MSSPSQRSGTTARQPVRKRAGDDAPIHRSNASGTGDAPDPIAAFRAASQQIVGLQQDYWKQVAGFWSGMPGAASWGLGSDTSGSAENDKRFANEAWRNDPRFDMVKRNYLAYSSFLQAAVDAMPLDEKAKAKLRYDTGQFIDAMSPANFLVTNPEAMQLAVETGGQSLTEGMRLFFDDLAKGRVSTTDETAYEVGRNLATTPGAVIYENDLIQVIQYAPTTERVHERPLLSKHQLKPYCSDRGARLQARRRARRQPALDLGLRAGGRARAGGPRRLPVLERHPRQRRRAPDRQRGGSRARVSQDDDDDWVGTPPEGHYTRDRAKPEFWRSQRPPALVAGAIGIVVLILIVVLLAR